MNSTEEPPFVIVQTREGPVKGSCDGAVETFFGIPYAQPPVGALRWRPPIDPQPRSAVLDAFGFGPDPMQRGTLQTSRAPRRSEDCLRLNVWRPAARDGLRPVMVWIHGGSFLFGSASDALTDGARFAESGVLCVSIGSRVGIFGFLAHPELIEESPSKSAGNYGLLDIIAGLRWIKQNIAAFGGDPDNITVFGVSSGAASIALLMTSPLASGLFDKVILQSAGSYRPLATLEAAAAEGGELGPLSTLRSAPADDVLALEQRLVPSMRRLTAPRILRPILDGWVVPLQDWEAFQSHAFAAVPTMIGSNADEGSLLVANWPVDTIAAWTNLVSENFQKPGEDVRQLYPVCRDEDARQALAALFGDTQFSLAAREIAREVATVQPQTYRYLFTHRRGGLPGGPDHGGEVPYVFDSLDRDGGPVDDHDRALAASMHAAWVRFAEFGHPGAVDGVAWCGAQHGMLDLGDPVAIRGTWREPQLNFVKAYITSAGEKQSKTKLSPL